MVKSVDNIRLAVVVTATCLLCVSFGCMLGLSLGRPGRHKVSSSADSAGSVIRVAAMLDAREFETVSARVMSLPECVHRSVQGMPLKMLKLKFADILRSGMCRRDASVLEKQMMDVKEAVFSDFTGAPVDDVDRFKMELLPLLEFPYDEGVVTGKDLNCFFGITDDGGRTLSALVLVLSHSNLQVVRFIGRMDPSVVDVLSGLR